MHGGRIAVVRRALGALLALALALVGLGACGTEQSTSNSAIVNALDLERTGSAYRIDGDPFCTVDELLNDADEVESAGDSEGASFLIASPNGEVGVLARRPFAPDCTRKARDALKRLENRAD